MGRFGKIRLHHTKHENGGVDEIDLTGLSGAYSIADLKVDHPTLTGAELHDPKAHKTSHQDGEADEISLSGLAGQQIAVPYNGKIADIREADTNKHTLDLAAALSETRKIIMIILNAQRVSGTGVFYTYPNEGASAMFHYTTYNYNSVIIKNGTNEVQYAQSVANDDWDVYCFGYVVEA